MRLLDKAIIVSMPAESVESLLGQQSGVGSSQGAFGSYGESSAASLASFALAHKDDPLIGIISSLREYISLLFT